METLGRMATILIADDLTFCLDLFALALRNAGYEVLCARDGVEVLEILKKNQPDLLVLDAEMPNLDGLGVLRVLRGNVRFAKTPVFMLTAHEERDLVCKARQLGVQEFILKSQFALPNLLERIRKYLPQEGKRGQVEEVEGEMEEFVAVPRKMGVA